MEEGLEDKEEDDGATEAKGPCVGISRDLESWQLE